MAKRNKQVLAYLEQWYSELYPHGDPALEGRFRDRNKSQFIAALYELLIHQYARKKGWNVDRNFNVDGKNPDFHFKEIDWICEVFTVGSSENEKREDAQVEALCRRLNGLESAYWIDLQDYELKQSQLAANDISDWVSSQLQANEGKAQFEVVYEDDRCVLQFGFHRKQEPSSSNVGLKGIQALDFEAVKSRTLNRLREKAKKYDCDGIIFACSGHATPRLDVEMLDECLYGERLLRLSRKADTEISYSENRVFSGFFSKVVRGKPQNRRIGAVVFCRYIVTEESCWALDLVVFHNPYARRSLDSTIFSPARQFAVTASDADAITFSWTSDLSGPFSLC